MKIVFQAFHWSCQSQIFGLKDFLYELCKSNGKSGNRITYLFEDEKYWIGLVLTIKDMKKFVTLQESKQEIKLEIHELSKNEKITDFNFFVIDHNTGYGLYQYYHQSCSLNAFNYIVKSCYNKYVNEVRLRLKEKYEREGKKKSEITKLMKKHHAKLTPSIVERDGSFIDRVKKMKDANMAEIQFIQIDFNNSPLQAIRPYLKTMKYKITFLKDISTIDKIRGIVDIFANNKAKKATIAGIDEYGHDVVYKLCNDFNKFQEYDYEDMVPSLNLDPEQVADSVRNNGIIVELKSVLNAIAPALPSVSDGKYQNSIVTTSEP